jgi:hypothetical protein
MATDDIVCTVCGAKNPGEIQRCRSCGARLEALAADGLDDEELQRGNQQEGFEWKWVGIAFGIYMVMQTLFLVALYYAIPPYDPQGLPGLAISAGVWFLGGVIVGAVSPGKTFLEPPVAAALSAIPTVLWLSYIADVDQLSALAYIVGGLMGVMITLFGAFLGEKIQMNGRGAGSHART